MRTSIFGALSGALLAGRQPDIAIRVPIVQSPRDEVLRQAIAIARRYGAALVIILDGGG